MKDIIDFNTGTIIEGEQTLEELSDNMLEFIIQVASGEKTTKASKNRQFDFLPWKRDISCLLYTSPSPRDRTRSRMPSSA